jgi:adenosylcobinamide kinase/adenosylcobinamide-phosphate guanylyltransferase
MTAITLVAGPARSGKSEWAEWLAHHSQKSVIYVATSQIDPADLEWQARIDAHQQRRSPLWETWSVPLHLANAVQRGTAEDCLLVDSLGTWVANTLEQEDGMWQDTCAALLVALSQTVSDIIFVAEETGWGIVPSYASGRLFRDRLGRLVREIGAIAQVTYLVAGGHVLNLSQVGTPLNQALQQTPP